VKSIYYEAPHYAIFSILLSLYPSGDNTEERSTACCWVKITKMKRRQQSAIQHSQWHDDKAILQDQRIIHIKS
jgi:hypothetical protein